MHCRTSKVEIIFVDDSDDGTPDAVARAGEEPGPDVVLVHRHAGQRAGGLSSAVVEGFRRARTPWICVTTVICSIRPKPCP